MAQSRGLFTTSLRSVVRTALVREHVLHYHIYEYISLKYYLFIQQTLSHILCPGPVLDTGGMRVSFSIQRKTNINRVNIKESSTTKRVQRSEETE